MESEKIGTNVLDLDLDVFLIPYQRDGRAIRYGHVLAKRMEKSRPRDSNRPPGGHVYPYPSIWSYKATGRRGIDGLYSLVKISRPNAIELMSWLQQIEFISMPDIEREGFAALLNGAAPFGEQCLKIMMTSYSNPGLRSDLGIKQNPVAAADAAFRAESNSYDFKSPWTQINNLGSPLPVQTPLASFTATIYHHRGAPFNWIIIPPTQKIAFENIIREEFHEEIKNQECSQFVHHLSLFILPERLRHWGIKYFEVTQIAGSLLFIFPGAYFYGFSAGHNVIEWKYHAGKQWNCNSYKFCQSEYFLCGREHQGKPPIYVRPAGDQGLALGIAGAERPLLPALKRRKRSKKSASPASSGANLPVDDGSLVDFTLPAVANNPGDMHRPGEGQTPIDYASPTLSVPAAPDAHIAYLMGVNNKLGQENRNLHQANRDLASKLQESSTEREVDLRDRLQATTTERDNYHSFLLDRDRSIEFLQAQLAETVVLSDELQIAVVQRDRLQSTQEATQGYVKSLEAQLTGSVESDLWKAAAMKTYWAVSERDKRVSELEKLLREQNIIVPEEVMK